MRVATAILVGGVLGLLSAGTAVAQQIADSPGNRITNPSAEQEGGTTGWDAAGVTAVDYGSGPHVPGQAFADERQHGRRLFAAQRADGTLAQAVDLSDLAGDIDAGRQRLSIGGAFGGATGQEGSTRLVVEFADGAGTPLATASVGGPTDADRKGQTTLLFCHRPVTAPAGTRRARVTLQAHGGGGGGLADSLYLTTREILFAHDSSTVTEGGCARPDPPPGPAPPPPNVMEPVPVAPPPARAAPRIATLVSMTPRRGCRRLLSFRVRPGWRGRVEQLLVAARDRTVSVDPRRSDRSIRVRASRRSLLVRLTVRLADGRRTSAAVRYRGCRR